MTWVRIQKLQVGYRGKALITNMMEKKVGKVEEVQTMFMVQVILFE
jgi:hypothetical protein